MKQPQKARLKLMDESEDIQVSIGAWSREAREPEFFCSFSDAEDEAGIDLECAIWLRRLFIMIIFQTNFPAVAISSSYANVPPKPPQEIYFSLTHPRAFCVSPQKYHRRSFRRHRWNHPSQRRELPQGRLSWRKEKNKLINIKMKLKNKINRRSFSVV